MLFQQYLLSAYHVPRTALGAGDSSEQSGQKSMSLRNFQSKRGGVMRTHNNKIKIKQNIQHVRGEIML